MINNQISKRLYIIIFVTYSLRCADVLYNKSLEENFKPFCLNVLHMQTSAEWEDLMADVKKVYPAKPPADDFYKQLLCSYNKMKPLSYLYRLYRSLKLQQPLLAEQVKTLLGSHKNINGYVEIGGPCRYADYINQHIPLLGKRYAIHDHAKMGDFLENKILNIGRGFVPYDTFISLADYEAISTKDIADESVDMVVCFIGLHHIPENKLKAFIVSINRILRPGGMFLLRDHDAFNDDIVKIASAAHTVFNAITAQSSSQQEAEELRNFKPLSSWIELLENNGFDVGPERLLQYGDPTLNTLIKCIKPLSSQDAFLHTLHLEKGHARAALQTFLTTTEWYNVDCSQAYADFLAHTPWYEFPYWQSIKTYWYLFGESFKQARSKNSLYDILVKNDYFSMSVFIGAFMTAEYGLKSLVALPVGSMVGAFDRTINIVVKDFPFEHLTTLPSRVIVKEKKDNFMVLEVPRYGDFQKTIAFLSKEAGTIIEIGGNTVIQVKIRIKNQPGVPFDRSALDPLIRPYGIDLSYTWEVPTVNYTYASLIVPVSKIKNLIKEAPFYTIEIVYIHDF